MTEHMQIAETIRSQISTIDKMALWAWGAKDYSAVPAGDHEIAAWKYGLHFPHAGGLHFRVNGATFKGHVYVTLNGSDMYDVKAVTPIRINRKTFNQTGGQLKIVIKDVFCTDLVDMLDSFIEHGAQQDDFDDPNVKGV